MNNSNSNQTISKSARQRLRQKSRLLAQMQALTVSPVAQPVNQNRQTGGRRRRRRNRRGNTAIGFQNNEYLKTLLYPEECQGCKVPDLVTFPSSTFSLNQVFNLDSKTGGNAAAVMFHPIVGEATGTSFGAPIRIFNSAVPNSTADESVINWTAVSTLRQNYGSYRPVSSSMVIQFIGDDQTNGGTLSGTILAREYSDETVSKFDSVTKILNLPGMKTYRLKDGLRMTWKPQDNRDFQFIDLSSSDPDLGQFPALIAVVTRSATFSGIVRVEICANFEATSAQESINQDLSTTSVANQSQLEYALNYLGQLGSNIHPIEQASPFRSSWMYSNAAQNVQAVTGVASGVGAFLLNRYNTGRRLLV